MSTMRLKCFVPRPTAAAQVVCGTLRSLRPLVERLPRQELDLLTREPSVLGCYHLGCTNRPGAGDGGLQEQELLLRVCDECGGPRYCSRDCANVARRERHRAACHWKQGKPL